MGRDCGWQRGEASEPQKRAQPQVCRGQSREIPAQRISADQHSPAREACLLTRRGWWGLGAEARDSEVRSQGEDWGWQREHSLNGATVPQIAGRESRKKLWNCRRDKRLFLASLFPGAREEGIKSAT